MRAIVFDGQSVKFVNGHAEPSLNAGEAKIRLLCAAVSSLDVNLGRGAFHFSGILGHQFVGMVHAIRDESDQSLVGKRVVGSIISKCNKCDLCLAGLGMHCRHRTVLGVHGRDGCFAEHFTLPQENLCLVPDDLDDDHAIFAHEVALAVQTTKQLAIHGKPYVTVLGSCSLGLITAQVLTQLNTSVRFVGDRPELLAVCEKWGIAHRSSRDVGHRADQDIVVDCMTWPRGIDLAMRLVRPRGKVVLKTLASPLNNGQHIDLSPLILKEIDLIGSFAGPVREGLVRIHHHEIDVVSLISRRMSLSDGPEVLKAAEQPGVIKVLISQ